MLAFYLSLIDSENDRKRFEEIYFMYRKQMYSVAMAVLNNECDAEDAVHDVFCSIAEKNIHVLHTLKNNGDIRNYLLKATKNRAINLSKRRTVSNRYKEEIIKSSSEKVVSDENFWDYLCSDITYKNLVNAIRSLDKKYSEVLYLHFILGLSVSETSKSLDRNVNTVKKQIMRGKALLFENLKESEVLINND